MYETKWKWTVEWITPKTLSDGLSKISSFVWTSVFLKSWLQPRTHIAFHWDTLFFSYNDVFCPFSSHELMSFPKLPVSDSSSAKCVSPRTLRFLLLHSRSNPSVNSNSNHLACHPRSFANMVGWAASCSGGICWAPDTSEEATREEKKKLFDHLQTTAKMIASRISRGSLSGDASTSKYQKKNKKKQIRWPQSVKLWTSWETHIYSFGIKT